MPAFITIEKAPLITTPTERRAFGFDTSQYAIGAQAREGTSRPENDFGLRLGRAEYVRITEALYKLSAASFSGERLALAKKINGAKIKYWVTVEYVGRDRGRLLQDRAERNLDGPNEFVARIKSANGRDTEMFVRTQKDRNGNFWLNVRANPSSLINGYNAYATAMPGQPRGAERELVLRAPFIVLKALLRKGQADFDWEPATARRIKGLQFKLCPIQIFTYLDTAAFTPERFLGFLRAVLSSPFGDGKAAQGEHRLVADLLGVEVLPKFVNRRIQSLLLVFRRGDCVELSVNLYNKYAKASQDAGVIHTEVGDDSVHQFLSSHLRADITLHKGALGDLMIEAGLGTKERVSPV